MNSLSAWVEQQIKFKRFMQKLLQEALELQVTKIEWRRTKEKLEITFFSSDQILKSVLVKPTWYPILEAYLIERRDIAFGNEALIEFPSHVAGHFAFRLPHGLLRFSCSMESNLGGNEKLIFSELELRAPNAEMQRLLLSEHSQALLESRTLADSGLMLIVAPNADQLAAVSAMVLSLTGAVCVKDLWQLSPKDLEICSSQGLLLATAIADDLSAVLGPLSQPARSGIFDHVVAAFCLGLVPRTCSACARKTPVDKALYGLLPKELKEPALDSYAVGRGCSECGERGIRGMVVIGSGLEVDEGLRQDLAASRDEEAIVYQLFRRGVRALLHDGVQKVREGVTNLQAVQKQSPTLPTSYAALLRSAPTVQGAAVNEGLFATEQIPQAQARPGAKIMVVEDNDDQRAILEMVLKNAGYQVDGVAGGEEALNYLATARPQLIVTDLMMPHIDGAELVRRLKSTVEWQDIPVLVLTVLSDKDKEYLLLDLGAEDYCEKTISRKLLLKRIENLLRRAS